MRLRIPVILDKLKSSKPDFNSLCYNISGIQRLTRSGNKGCGNVKEVGLSSVDGNGTFSGKCFNCGKTCGYQAIMQEMQRGFERLPIVAPTKCAISVE